MDMEIEEVIIYYKCTACSECFINEDVFFAHTRTWHCKILISHGAEADDHTASLNNDGDYVYRDAARSQALSADAQLTTGNAAFAEQEAEYVDPQPKFQDQEEENPLSIAVVDISGSEEISDQKPIVPSSVAEINEVVHYAPDGSPYAEADGQQYQVIPAHTVSDEALLYSGGQVGSFDQELPSVSGIAPVPKQLKQPQVWPRNKSVNRQRFLLPKEPKVVQKPKLFSYRIHSNQEGKKVVEEILDRPQRRSVFLCRWCKKPFPSTGALEMHERVHTGEKPFECHVCSRRFTQAGNLRSHIRTHTGAKPYECSKCHRRYGQKYDLKKHLLICTGENT